MDLTRYYENYKKGIGSDCTFKVGEKEYKVHRVMFYRKSDYFRNIAEELLDQGKPFIIDLTNLIESRIFEIILRYLYIGKTELSRDKLDHDDTVRVTEAADVLEIVSFRGDLSSARKFRRSGNPYFVKKYEDYKKGLGTNCIIKIGEKEHRIHRNLFYGKSNYFSRIAEELLEQEKPFVIDWTNLIDSRAFEIIIRYIYIEEIELNTDKLSSEDLIHIIKGARFLLLQELHEKCSSYVEQLMSGPGCSSVPESLRKLILDYKPTHWW